MDTLGPDNFTAIQRLSSFIRGKIVLPWAVGTTRSFLLYYGHLGTNQASRPACVLKVYSGALTECVDHAGVQCPHQQAPLQYKGSTIVDTLSC